MGDASQPVSRFWQWLEKLPPASPSLAWCHSADSFTLRKILESRLLLTSPCRVFKADLLYFFYGRPSYRKNATGSIGFAARAPVVLVLNPQIVVEGERLYPFDSGAYADRRYQRWMHEGMHLQDFEMPSEAEAPGRHVATFFGGNVEYLRLRSKIPDAARAGEHEVDCLVGMLTDTDASTADDRRTAVELQLARPVPLDAEHIWAIILPEQMTDAPYVRSFLAKAGDAIEIVTYAMSPLKQASEYQGLLEERSFELQQRRGLV